MYDLVSGIHFAYIESVINVDGIDVSVKIDIKKSPQKNKFWVHSVQILEKANEQPAVASRAIKQDNDSSAYESSVPNSTENVNTKFQDRVVSNREILVDAMSNIDELSVEDRNRLAIYREKIDSMNELERELSSVGKQIHETITTPNSDRSELAKLNAKADTLRKKISRVDGALLKIEAMKPIQNLVEIRKKQIIKAQNQKAQEQRHRNVEGRNKTALKNKIKRVIKELKEIIKGYCHLTGFAKLPPLWSFGLWMSRNSYTSWNIAQQIANEARENDVPCDVIHLDTAWFTEDWNCDLKFSEERFPNPKEHISQLNKQGFKVSLWQYNFIPPRENNTHYAEALKNGYLVTDKNGKPYIQPKGCKGSWTDDTTVDFTNPDARKWYGEKIKGLFDLGASVIKTDFGEGVPDDGIYHSVDGKLFHNLYSLVYNATVFNASGENIVWARSGTAGSQRFPLQWGGDSQCTFEALAGTLRGALSVGMSGIPFWSHDIGGFIGLPSDELYIRWAQMGLFSSHSRCHGVGNNTHREPWNFSKEALDIFRYYDKLRYSLMPYIYEQAEKCTQTGLPMMRALYLEYPDDRTVRYIDDEYLFGDKLLIAPVLKPMSKSKTRELYLPKGIWFDYFTKEKIVSDGKWITREIDLKTMPIYIKEGTVLNYCSADTTLANGMGEIVKTEKWV